MNLMLDISIKEPAQKINYQEPLLLIGSCFTEHIGNYLRDLKFDILQNPNGILFDPRSVAWSLVSYVQNKKYAEDDLFYLNELWQSWQHHSFFSGTDKAEALTVINKSQQVAHDFLKKTKWVIITLGSSFSYRLLDNNMPVANCHRAPAQWFNKHLMTIEEINSILDNCVHQLLHFNPDIKIIFTVSPVRHIRDGVIENNRSKARLIEVVHHLVNKFEKIYYFPAYELVVDVLRDYRFFDIDMVHPNYQATEFVLQNFIRHFIDEASQNILAEVKKIIIARKHRSFHPSTNLHQNFLREYLKKTEALKSTHPFLNLDDEIKYFSSRFL
ncbi:MAG TPA: GSCFA domain-containing protein [Puia sp.]|nr:GSCFA domain-containing protein [Puia sp.]